MDRLILPGLAPSVNHMYITARRGHKNVRVLTKDAQQWRDEMIAIANNWRVKNKWSTADRKVIVRLWFYFPDKRRRDTHNGLKVLLDALEDALIYEDDKLALPQVIDFEFDKQNPRIEIEFEKVE
ncbi:RusA family crossover junction endodeoxyribonuclease [Paenibacillus puldeungensis]|uniref:RusA family crossover junction endodeoxyribonuclease n=1 Tax=Paenibacillus puldeungensis TaxID=696536 RepID=A0ABW3S3Y6_9BACL